MPVRCDLAVRGAEPMPLVPALNERLVQAGRGVQLDSKGNVLLDQLLLALR